MNRLLSVLVVGLVVAACGPETVAVIENDEVPAGPLDQAETSEQALTASNFFPLRPGNTWTLSDGTTTRTVRVTRSSGTLHLVEGLSSSGSVWLSFVGSRLWVWNATDRVWQTMVNFGSATATKFSFGGPCETFTVTQDANKLALVTPAGSFSPAVRYSLTLSPPPHVRCAMPALASLTFAENVGLLEIRNPNQVVSTLQSASVSGRTYPVPSARATLTVSPARAQLDADGNVTLRATLVVKNETSRAMTFQFPSSQQFELSVETASGETAYFWSADKSFLTALSSFTLQPNQSRTFTESFTMQYATAGWHTVKAWLPTSTGPKAEASAKVELVAAPSRCFVGGCSSQVCSDRANVVTTCDYRPQYACYRTAKCERQTNGQCGWTMTTALQQCLAR